MNNIKKMKNLKIIEDWEREYLKDFIYLHEQGQDWNEAIQRELNQKQPARIEVIDTDKILEKHNEPHANILPF
jgi:hypothetical protein